MKAFPTIDYINAENSYIYESKGMELRDYFAAKAMQSLLTHDLAYLYDKAEQISLDTAEEYVVETAFHIADEMMKARKK